MNVEEISYYWCLLRRNMGQETSFQSATRLWTPGCNIVDSHQVNRPGMLGGQVCPV